jgi:hypothetical protein
LRRDVLTIDRLGVGVQRSGLVEGGRIARIVQQLLMSDAAALDVAVVLVIAAD